MKFRGVTGLLVVGLGIYALSRLNKTSVVQTSTGSKQVYESNGSVYPVEGWDSFEQAYEVAKAVEPKNSSSSSSKKKYTVQKPTVSKSKTTGNYSKGGISYGRDSSGKLVRVG